ncbi:MAG: hypothetical protein RLY66_390 [Candidatus Parcubacteria bacterium]|jgi:uncharacterized protein YqgC (DUF456 family)
MDLVSTAYAKVDANAFGNVLNPIISNIIQPVVGLMFAIAIVVFTYGVFQVVWGKDESREAGKKSMIGGIIGMFIMTSAWGIIYVISNTVLELGR